MLGGSATTNGAPGADAQTVLNVPVIADRLAIRLVADSASEGGYIDKPLLGRTDVNRTRIAGGRAAVKADLGAAGASRRSGSASAFAAPTANMPIVKVRR